MMAAGFCRTEPIAIASYAAFVDNLGVAPARGIADPLCP